MAKGIRGGRERIMRKPIKRLHEHPEPVFSDDEWILLTLNHIEENLKNIRSTVKRRMADEKKMRAKNE